MFAERNHGARLWTLSALGVSRDKTHFITHRELVEAAIRDTVAVEVNLVAVGALDEAAILLGNDPRDPPIVGHRVHFYIATSLASVVFEQPPGSVKRIADRDIDILMRMVRRGITADDDLAPGNLEVDANSKQIALLMTRVLALHDDTARCDAIKESFELFSPLSYACRDRVGSIHVPKVDLKRKRHRIFPSG
jgi:hypothetical protein